MSILIKGMEMPKDKEIILRIDEEGQVYNIYGEYPTKIYEDIEIPPHGRLIDADALNELIDSGDDIDFSEVPETKYAIMQMVDEQDTILEASPYRYKMIGKTDKPHGIYFFESEE